MKTLALLSLAVLAATPFAQTFEQAYDRDTHQSFTLKEVKTDTLVKGPMVIQKTLFTFDNPHKKLTEASLWFSLNEGAVLDQFAYWYQNEYVPGMLMSKAKAWHIYTAITSRNEDPGIMVQTTPQSYHCQIYPLAVGYDLRFEVQTVGFLRREGDQFKVPEPTFQALEGKAVTASHAMKSDQSVSVASGIARFNEEKPGFDLQLYGQRFKDGATYVAGVLRTDRPNDRLKVSGLRQVKWISGDAQNPSTKYFIGRRWGAGPVRIRSYDAKGHLTHSIEKPVRANERGNKTAKLWAHQRLVQDEWRRGADVLRFSLNYGIPSSQTALLAVPKDFLKLFREKAAEYERKKKEDARRQRNWQNERNLNWRSSGGGDPEIRIEMPGARRVEAILPDGERFELRRVKGETWGGSFDIPAQAPEGDFVVRLLGEKPDGTVLEKKVVFRVDRTAPTGNLAINGEWVVLRAEPNLGRAVAVFGDGSEVTMVETSPGVYHTPRAGRRLVKVVLIDEAHNLSEVAWSPSSSR